MLNTLKMFLGIAADDTDRDDLLTQIIVDSTARLRVLLGGIEPPEEMGYIIREVSVIRFNRIGSEGLSSHNVEGESLAFGDDDFKGYADEIQAFLNKQKENTRGKVRFI